MANFGRETYNLLRLSEHVLIKLRYSCSSLIFQRHFHDKKKPLTTPSYIIPDDEGVPEDGNIDRSLRYSASERLPRRSKKTRQRISKDSDYFPESFGKVPRITRPANLTHTSHKKKHNSQNQPSHTVNNFKFSYENTPNDETDESVPMNKHAEHVSSSERFDRNDFDLLNIEAERTRRVTVTNNFVPAKSHTLDGIGKRESSYIRNASRKSIPKIKAEIVFGLYPVLLALQEKRRTCYSLYVKPDLLNSTKSVLQDIVHLASSSNIRVKPCDLADLDALSGYRPHQGVCLDADRLSYHALDEESLSSYISAVDQDGPQLWVMLDSVKDPMNFGAILRSSYYLGVDRVLSVKKNSCALSPVVSKASCGVLELWPVYTVQHKISFIKVMKEFGWQIIGTTGCETEESSDQQIMPVHQVAMDTNTILLLGNEGEGLSADVRGHCQHLVTVLPGRDLHPGIDSLNVSVATGILLHALASSRNSG